MTIRSILTFCLTTCCASQLLANVSGTEPVGGNNVPADLAQNSTNGPAFAPLGNIVLTEGASSDFAAVANQTFILTAPSGWRFQAGTGTATFPGSPDIPAAALSVTASNILATLPVTAPPPPHT